MSYVLRRVLTEPRSEELVVPAVADVWQRHLRPSTLTNKTYTVSSNKQQLHALTQTVLLVCFIQDETPWLEGSLTAHRLGRGRSSRIPIARLQRLEHLIMWMVGHTSHYVFCCLHLQPKHPTAGLLLTYRPRGMGDWVDLDSGCFSGNTIDHQSGTGLEKFAGRDQHSDHYALPPKNTINHTQIMHFTGE